MGEEAGRDRLEELQRRPGDHQHVEDEPGRGGALSCAPISSGPALRKVCSLNMISSTAAAKPVPWASENSGAASLPLAPGIARTRARSGVRGRRPRARRAERERDDEQAEAGGGDDARSRPRTGR